MDTSLPYAYQPKVTGGFCSASARASRLDRLTTPEIHTRIYALDSSNPELLLAELRRADEKLAAAEKSFHMARVERDAKVKELEKDLIECWTKSELRKAKILVA